MATLRRSSVLGRGLPRPTSVNNTDSTRRSRSLRSRDATSLRLGRCGDLRAVDTTTQPRRPCSALTHRWSVALSTTPERPTAPGLLPGPAHPELDSLARESLHTARLARAQARSTTQHRSAPEPGTVALSTPPERPVGGCGPARRLGTASKLARINFRPNLTLLFSLLRTTQQREPHGARCGRAPFGRAELGRRVK